MSLPDRLCPWLVEPLTRLENAAVQQRLGHGWLISGAEGIGKRNLAYMLAERLLHGQLGQGAAAPASARDMVAAYQALAEAEDLHPDLHRVRAEDGKATISVEQIRAMTAELALKPHTAGLKLVIIEKAETMTREAANSLLKSLEEPTPDTFLLLLAARPGRLPATIQSRCQRLRLKAPGAEEAIDWLSADYEAAGSFPARRLAAAPIAWAELFEDPDNISFINKIYSDINSIYQEKADVYAVAERWHKGDLGLALSCFTDSLRETIRQRLVPGHSNPITDGAAAMAQNMASGISIDALFASLKLAENLRDQLGRGINEELALEAILLGMSVPADQRVNT